jgi:hypothetical protein
VGLNQSIAAFLLVRGPIGYIGYGWESGDEMWNSSFLLQPGSPVGDCAEVPALYTIRYKIWHRCIQVGILHTILTFKKPINVGSGHSGCLF